MIVEHTFVTPLEAADAFAAAEKIIEPLAFTRDLDSGSTRAWRRGKDDAARVHSLDKLPQRLRMDFDRGRVAVAAAVDLGRLNHALPPQLMVALTLAFERAMALGQTPAQAGEDVGRIQASILRRDRRVRLGWMITGVVIIGSFVALLAVAAWRARH